MNNLRIGVVEDRHDPLKMGRVRVRVFGVHNHERKAELPIESLPWSLVVHSPLTPTPAGNVHQLKEGTWVVVAFLDENCQDSIVLGSLPSNYEEQPNYEEGFSDPFGVLPRWHGFDSDTSLVTKEEEWKEHPTYHEREKYRVLSIPKAKRNATPTVASFSQEGRQTWEELELRAGQESQYPYNAVREFEAGMLEEYDSTPSNSRITEMHRSGTYEEIIDNGSKTVKIVGDSYHITLKDENVYIEGDLNLTVGGNMRQYVKGNYILEVDGDYSMTVGGSRQSKINLDDVKEVVGIESTSIGRDQFLLCGAMRKSLITLDDIKDVFGNETTTILGNQTFFVTGNQTSTIGGGQFAACAANREFISGASTRIISNLDITMIGLNIFLN